MKVHYTIGKDIEESFDIRTGDIILNNEKDIMYLVSICSQKNAYSLTSLSSSCTYLYKQESDLINTIIERKFQLYRDNSLQVGLSNRIY